MCVFCAFFPTVNLYECIAHQLNNGLEWRELIVVLLCYFIQFRRIFFQQIFMLTCKAVCFSLIVFYLILIFLSWSHFLCGCNVFLSFASSFIVFFSWTSTLFLFFLFAKHKKIELFKRKTWCRSRQTDMHTYREYTKATNCIQSSIEFMSTTSQK